MRKKQFNDIDLRKVDPRGCVEIPTAVSAQFKKSMREVIQKSAEMNERKKKNNANSDKSIIFNFSKKNKVEKHSMQKDIGK